MTRGDVEMVTLARVTRGDVYRMTFRSSLRSQSFKLHSSFTGRAPPGVTRGDEGWLGFGGVRHPSKSTPHKVDRRFGGEGCLFLYLKGGVYSRFTGARARPPYSHMGTKSHHTSPFGEFRQQNHDVSRGGLDRSPSPPPLTDGQADAHAFLLMHGRLSKWRRYWEPLFCQFGLLGSYRRIS